MGTGSKRPVDVPQIGVITDAPESFNPLFCAWRPAFKCDTHSDYATLNMCRKMLLNLPSAKGLKAAQGIVMTH